MRPLSLIDQALLVLEKQKQPMHVGGLFIFDIPEYANSKVDHPDFVAQIIAQLQHSTIPPAFPFNQVLHKVAFWQTTEHIDVSLHLHHVQLNTLHKSNALLNYISNEHSKLLDRSRPLWECHIIEGFSSKHGAPKQFALYFKIHHALVDGVAAMRLVQHSLSTSANDKVDLPLWALINRDPMVKNKAMPPKRSIKSLLSEQLSTVKPVLNELKNSLAQRQNPNHITTTQAPRSLLNQRISNKRQLVTHSYAIARFNAVADRLQVSLNDVALAVCAGALRRYLLAAQQLPSKPLIAFVPISLRQDDSMHGNQASLVLCNLGTHLSDPLERIQTIHQSMQRGKALFGRMTQAEVINYSAMAYAWEGVNLLTNALPKKQAFNLIISNISGPKQPLYWHGAKLTALYPASVIFNGQALNITVIRCLNHLDFGFLTCPETLRNTDCLPHYITTELALLESNE